MSIMNLRDDIRNYEVISALPTELIKTSRKYKVLAFLKYSFPERFSRLQKSEAPDLQEPDGNLAVEVTWGGSPRDELISGESIKYDYARKETKKKKCLQKIRKNGGDRDDISISFPMSTVEEEKKTLSKFLRKS